jgi:hypothetical protein
MKRSLVQAGNYTLHTTLEQAVMHHQEQEQRLTRIVAHQQAERSQLVDKLADALAGRDTISMELANERIRNLQNAQGAMAMDVVAHAAETVNNLKADLQGERQQHTVLQDQLHATTEAVAILEQRLQQGEDDLQAKQAEARKSVEADTDNDRYGGAAAAEFDTGVGAPIFADDAFVAGELNANSNMRSEREGETTPVFSLPAWASSAPASSAGGRRTTRGPPSGLPTPHPATPRSFAPTSTSAPSSSIFSSPLSLSSSSAAAAAAPAATSHPLKMALTLSSSEDGQGASYAGGSPPAAGRRAAPPMRQAPLPPAEKALKVVGYTPLSRTRNPMEGMHVPHIDHLNVLAKSKSKGDGVGGGEAERRQGHLPNTLQVNIRSTTGSTADSTAGATVDDRSKSGSAGALASHLANLAVNSGDSPLLQPLPLPRTSPLDGRGSGSWRGIENGSGGGGGGERGSGSGGITFDLDSGGGDGTHGGQPVRLSAGVPLPAAGAARGGGQVKMGILASPGAYHAIERGSISDSSVELAVEQSSSTGVAPNLFAEGEHDKEDWRHELDLLSMPMAAGAEGANAFHSLATLY